MLSHERVEKALDLLAKHLERSKRDTLPDKNLVRKLLILLRFAIRECMARYNLALSKLRYYERQKEILERKGVRFVLLDPAISVQRTERERVQGCLQTWGDLAITLLDWWQAAGATREELLDLCGVHLNAWPEWRHKGLAKEEPGILFSKLVFVYNLDYPVTNGDGLMDETDAPFTHSTKEYMLYLMCHTKEGRQAAREAMEEVFPGIMEHRMTLARDAGGREVLLDKDGVFVGYVNEEGDHA